MNVLPSEYFQRMDNSNDAQFYQFARKVVHIDQGAIRTLTDFYARILRTDSTVLDLMSSWRSHLPETLGLERTAGLGMNADEMRDNPQLSDYVVHNLNERPQLPYKADEFDAVVCAVSVQYLQKPIEVFKEAARVTRPNGVMIVSFSNRCFPSKAVAAWLSMSDMQHVDLVRRYFELAGHWEQIRSEIHTPRGQDPLFIVYATKSS